VIVFIQSIPFRYIIHKLVPRTYIWLFGKVQRFKALDSDQLQNLGIA